MTHSPFIIHNERRRNDKVIVASRDGNGKICVKERPEHHRCDSTAAVEDAFGFSGFDAGSRTAYVEGQTDERCMNRAMEVFKEELVSQFRCNGSDGYLAWLDDVLDVPTNRPKPSSRLSPPQRITDNRNIGIKHVAVKLRLYSLELFASPAVGNSRPARATFGRSTWEVRRMVLKRNAESSTHNVYCRKS